MATLKNTTTNDASGGDAALWIQGTNADWGVLIDKPSYDFGFKYNLPSSHTYGIAGHANGTIYFRVGSDGLVHTVGTRSPIFYDSDNTAYYCDPASTTNINTLTAVSITESSSIKLKENINPLENALNKINQLVGVSYLRTSTKKNEVGLIAEEVDKIIPEIVSKNDVGDPEGIQYTKLTAYLIEAVKELTKQIEELKNGRNL